jgi:hypothetical protein
MADPSSAPIAWLDPRALACRLDEPAAGHLDAGDREALRAILTRATRVASPAGDLIVAVR